MLKLQQLEKSVAHQGGRLWLLHGIDLEVPAGEFLSVVGPSGSGKTTLLNIIGMFDHDWQGEYHFRDQPVHAMKPAARQALARDQVGFVFQQYHLLEDLTVAENLDVPLGYRKLGRRERRERVAEMLERFGITAKRDLFPNQLSGGQQQLVAVARALVARPSLILADEPTGALHSSQGTMIMDALCDLHREGVTIVQVTHNEGFAARGTRVIHLLDGRLAPGDDAAQ